MMASVADISELEISTAVSEYMARYIHTGDVVDVYVASLGDEPFSGTITAFSPAPALGTMTYPVTVTLDNSGGQLMSGMFAEIRIRSEAVSDAVMVPADAVIVKNGKSVVVTVDADNIPKFNEVETGLDNGEYTEIVSGIREGDVIVVSGQDFVTEGVEVNVVE
jgi:RND family efflux transporter MFP subunit